MERDFSTLLGEFLGYLTAERSASPNTLTAYSSDLRQFADHHAKLNRPVSALSRQEISAYLGTLTDRGLKQSSVFRKYCSIRSFYSYLAREELVPKDPCATISVRWVRRPLPRLLTQTEMLKLIESVRGNSELEVRDRAILELWYATGYRVSEIGSITLASLDLPAGELRVRGKGDKERLTPLTATACRWLGRWLEVRATWTKARGTLFISHRHLRGMSRMWYRRMVKRYAARAGIQKNVHPHVLRHSFATHLLTSGAGLRDVQELLGHRSIQTTSIYTHLDTSDLSLTLRAHHPRP